ncbi:MAG TPA: DMT family transporter [Patescibacteria group bacterium]|nr:DMT family transporter [Patescibacteria group bacterium]
MTSPQKNNPKGILALLILSFLFALYGPLTRYLNTGFAISQQIYLRIFAAVLISIVLFNKDLSFKKIKKIPIQDWGVLIFRSISFYVIGSMLFSLAAITTKIGNVAVIGSIPMTAILGFLIGEKFSFKKGLYIFISFVGIILIAAPNIQELFLWGKGETLIFIATFFFSASYVVRKWHTNYLNNKEITILIFSISAVIMIITSLFMKQGFPNNVFKPHYFTIILISAFLNVISLFLTNYGFQKVQTSLASNILTLEAVFGLILGFIFYKEVPILKELIGAIVVIGGVLLLNNEESKNSPS